MGKTKRPESKVTSGVGDSSKNEFNGFDQLMNHVFAKTVGVVATLVTNTGDNV
jgi:hypothetical protein